jgi:hypothetical protein
MMEGPWCRFRREARAREDIDTVLVDRLKALDPNRPIREADIDEVHGPGITLVAISSREKS